MDRQSRWEDQRARKKNHFQRPQHVGDYRRRVDCGPHLRSTGAPTGGSTMRTRVFAAAFFALSIAVASRESGLSLRAQTSAQQPKVEVATIKRNKDVEGARASAPAGTPIPPARIQ